MSKRIWARTQILASADFRNASSKVMSTLQEFKLDFTLIGGLAVAFHANPPVTVDIDFLVNGSLEDLKATIPMFEESGWEAITLRFAHRQKGLPRGGIRISIDSPATDVDLIVTGEDEYLSSVVERSTFELVQKDFLIPIVKPEDLIVMKTLVGREKDAQDVIAISQALRGVIDENYIDDRLEELL